jgi:hypothetical protein
MSEDRARDRALRAVRIPVDFVERAADDALGEPLGLTRGVRIVGVAVILGIDIGDGRVAVLA